jgi:hypothetical protein
LRGYWRVPNALRGYRRVPRTACLGIEVFQMLFLLNQQRIKVRNCCSSKVWRRGAVHSLCESGSTSIGGC